jgi:PleD family two-component response regulator
MKTPHLTQALLSMPTIDKHHTVKDTGISISKSHLESLLSPFISNLEENLDENKIMQYRKPSIKLYYIKTMLDYMSGSIFVKSKQRKGTEITVTIPFSESASKTKKLKFRPFQEKTLTLQNLSILLVEDNPVTLEIEKNELEQLTKIIDTTENGLEAIALSQNKAYDIIFLDLTLGDITGIEVMQKIEFQYADKME